ncbi:MAG: hypothetical protein E7604_05435 [Ruminococcaceae bacterium]|nr:hypothetical protein [Oscillospiraceae bacterium]
MITIENTILKKQKNFWNNCLFHPTDAIEDPWGKKILDRMAGDKSIHAIRIYTMFEDIVYLDEDGNLAYDFRLNDLRLDYLVEKGYDVLLAYAMMPECIATNKNAVSSVSKNKTRYKGKMINTSAPTDYALWEEICYTYTKHLLDRYGEETVSKWHMQCFNEPDLKLFFLSDLPWSAAETRAEEYCKLYTAFASGISRASEKCCFGGPALASNLFFMEKFLTYIRQSGTRLDFISVHNYAGICADELCNTDCGFSVKDWLSVMEGFLGVIDKCGFSDKELIVDEWGMAGQGFYNIEECPMFIARENETFSAYYVKLIHELLRKGWKISKLFICLSGQHEMVVDFSGFRNFFTMNFFAKPIYNAYVLASRLYENLLPYCCDTENVYVIPTRNEQNQYRILVTYSSEKFDETLSTVREMITLPAEAQGKTVTLYQIDRNTTNPYRLYERLGLSSNLTDEEIRLLREEGRLTATDNFVAADTISLELTANAVYMIEVC